ncbi:serine/threonine-protein phosphatase [Flammeovirga yaeyamensis]|uniref:Serine/threonine-protein phosphatase n=1 Tax=Flammeovirga yaeyamensis TaxID=367791 RepID=A0AAX1N777_9BACT|nr:SpoIIE family protein phosphatase [Flammeovirga yaeyamensis]MBB3698009.1 serine phosphatase RsbU (regulator of sigma subunit) [Flammeovirga yaeyamensis]NMF35639.1 SpoIIE family protein phosphatase [Flammeovirga yaeyamensis]QWG03404.1 serine/threonine-protein phosphatase [Flammeovirga yaeyamensis]
MFKRVQNNIFSFFFSVVIVTFLVLVGLLNTLISNFEDNAVRERLHDVGLALKDFIIRDFEEKESIAVTLSKTITDEEIAPLYAKLKSTEGKEYSTKELQYNFDRIYLDYGKKYKGKFNEGDLSKFLIEANFEKSGIPYMLWMNNKKNKNEKPYLSFRTLTNVLNQFGKVIDASEVLLVSVEKGIVLGSNNNESEIGQTVYKKLFSEKDIQEMVLMVNEGKRDFYWLDVSNSKINLGNTRCYLATKIGKNKKYVMLFSFDTNKWHFNKSVEEHSTDVFLTGLDGLMRTNSYMFKKNPSAIWLRMSQEGYNLDELEAAKSKKSIIGFQKVDQKILDSIKKYDDSILEAKSVNGIHVLANAVALKRPGLDWYVVVEWSRAVAFAEWDNLRVYINSVLAIVAVFFLLGILYGGKRLSSLIFAFKSALADLVKNPKLFMSNSHKYRHVSSDMMQQLEIISEEIIKLYDHNDKLQNDVKLANIHMKKMNVTIDNQTVDQKKLHREKENVSKDLKEYKHKYTKGIHSLQNILQTSLFDDNLNVANTSGHFLISKKKSEISGDFVWVCERESRVFFVVGDTGKTDLQGALLRIVLSDLFTEIVKVKKISSPDRILEYLHKLLYDLIIRGEEIFDKELCMSVCVWDRQKQMIEFAGANQSLFVTRDENYEEFIGDENGVGGIGNESQLKFQNHYIPLNRVKVCYIYLFTDGIINQRNADNVAFSKNRLKELIIDVQIEGIDKQEEYIKKTLEEWKGDMPQEDDLSLMSIKVI